MKSVGLNEYGLQSKCAAGSQMGTNFFAFASRKVEDKSSIDAYEGNALLEQQLGASSSTP